MRSPGDALITMTGHFFVDLILLCIAALQKMSMGRSASGNACLRREYRFEFTAEGSYRDTGTVTLNGHALANVYLPYTRDEQGNRVFVH